MATCPRCGKSGIQNLDNHYPGFCPKAPLGSRLRRHLRETFHPGNIPVGADEHPKSNLYLGFRQTPDTGRPLADADARAQRQIADLFDDPECTDFVRGGFKNRAQAEAFAAEQQRSVLPCDRDILPPEGTPDGTRNRQQRSDRREPPLGTGERFARLTADLRARGVRNPAGLAAVIGRRKYGPKKMAQLAAAGRRRRAGGS